VRKCGGDGVTFSGVEHVEPRVGVEWCGFNGDPSEIAQVGHSNWPANLTFFHYGFDNVKMAMDSLKEIKST
jgi:hypothetical protein